MTKEDLIWNYYSEQRTQGRSFDDQRSSLCRIIVTVNGVLIAYIASQDLDVRMLPLALLIAALGIFGLMATSKLYERQELHYLRARKCLEKLDNEIGNNELLPLIDSAFHDHDKKFKLATRLESRSAWMILHSIISIYGIYIVHSLWTLPK